MNEPPHLVSPGRVAMDPVVLERGDKHDVARLVCPTLRAKFSMVTMQSHDALFENPCRSITFDGSR